MAKKTDETAKTEETAKAEEPKAPEFLSDFPEGQILSTKTKGHSGSEGTIAVVTKDGRKFYVKK